MVLWGPLNTEMVKAVILVLANPPTVTNLGDQKDFYSPQRRHG